jgi:hypothetical protein
MIGGSLFPRYRQAQAIHPLREPLGLSAMNQLPPGQRTLQISGALPTGEPAPESHVAVLEGEAAGISICPLAKSLPSSEYAAELPIPKEPHCRRLYFL